MGLLSSSSRRRSFWLRSLSLRHRLPILCLIVILGIACVNNIEIEIKLSSSLIIEERGKSQISDVHTAKADDDSTVYISSNLTETVGNFTGCGGSNPIFDNYFSVSRRDYLTPLWLEETKNARTNTVEGTNQLSFSLKSDEVDIKQRRRLLIVLVIGDSLDRIMVERGCLLLNGTTYKVEPQNEKSRPYVCDLQNSTTRTIKAIGYLNIFGMHTQCQPNKIRLVDRTQSLEETTADRIKKLLPQVLDLIELDMTVVSNIDWYVHVGSNLWDLSTRCNNQVGITGEYERIYRQGIVEVDGAIRETIAKYPSIESSSSWRKQQRIIQDVRIVWKLAPPVSLKYSNQMKRKQYGRIRSNQQRLNDILRDVAFMTTGNLGNDDRTATGPTRVRTTATMMDNGNSRFFIDYWDAVMQNMGSEDNLNAELQKDGIHYGHCPSLVFFNMLLESIATTMP